MRIVSEIIRVVYFVIRLLHLILFIFFLQSSYDRQSLASVRALQLYFIKHLLVILASFFRLQTWWCLFVLSFFPRGVLDEILNLIESVSEGFSSFFSRLACMLSEHRNFRIKIELHKSIPYLGS